jgi:hypothetical protein
MIKILNSSFERQAVLKNIINPNRFEEINGENALTFSAILDEKTSTHINENAVVELNNDYFDIAYFKKNQNEGGILTIDVETEHISYRLNDPEYDMEYFASTGSPATVLSAIISGTGFTVGTIEFAENATYSIQEKKSRRMMLMEFAALVGGEVSFDKFEISILEHRGSTEPKMLAKGKNIKIVSKIFNKRERNAEGNLLISYTCSPIMLPDIPLSLGDEVLLIQKDLGIKEQLRIVRIGYNPYNPIDADIELANFVSGLEDDIYRIKTSTIAKEKVYNGCRIGPDDGFVATRSDKLARNRMNATEGNVLEIGDGTGNYTPVFFVAVDPDTGTAKLFLAGDAVFQGELDAASGTFNGELKAGQKYKVRIYENSLNGIIQFLDEINSSAGTISYNGTGIVMQALKTLFLDGKDVYLESDDDVTITTNRYFSVNSPNIQFTATTGKATYSVGGGVSSEIATQAWVNDQDFTTGSNASGVFATADGKTVTVEDGIITSIT